MHFVCKFTNVFFTLIIDSGRVSGTVTAISSSSTLIVFCDQIFSDFIQCKLGNVPFIKNKQRKDGNTCGYNYRKLQHKHNTEF